MKFLLCFVIAITVWGNLASADKYEDKLSGSYRSIHKREAYGNGKVTLDGSYEGGGVSTQGHVYHELRPSSKPHSAGTDIRTGNTRVTIANSTGYRSRSRTYKYPFGKEKTQYVYISPETTTKILPLGDESIGDRGTSYENGVQRSYGVTRRYWAAAQRGSWSQEEERMALLRNRDRLLRERQEIEEMKNRQREEMEAVRREEEAQRKQREEEEQRKQREEEQRRRLDEERRRHQEQQRTAELARRQAARHKGTVGQVSEEVARRAEAEKRRRYYEMRRRQQQQQQGYGYTNTRSPYVGGTSQDGGSQIGGQYQQQGARNTNLATGYEYPYNLTYASGNEQDSSSRLASTYEVYGRDDSSSDCPDMGLEMRINGMDCQSAVRTLGPYLCYTYEHTSKLCCEICKGLKQPLKVGCEYGDHVENCKILSPSDCYDLRNRHSCCATCERFRKPDALPGCEYGDAVDRCDSVRQNPGLCYVPNNQRSCCHTCSQIKSTNNPACAYGDYVQSLCQNYDSITSGNRVNCYSPHRRKMCCQTCERIRELASVGMPSDCQYGDRPISFYYPQFGRLTCSNMFQYIDVTECRNNPVVATNCCYTCNRYLNSLGG